MVTYARDLRAQLRTLLDLYTDDRVVALVLVLSSACGLVAFALGLRMIAIASATLIPWMPVLVRKIRGDWVRYGWLALFELVVILQLAHFAEHVSQMVELHWFEWPAFRARGIVGELDIEPVHWWWNTFILATTTILLFRFRTNRWLWASFFFSIWHEAEHFYVYFFWFLPKGISGHPGILGAGGLLDQADITIPFLTDLSRPDLHFWYNLFEIGLFIIAFVVQILHMRRANVTVSQWSWKRRALFAAAFAQIPLVLLVALANYSPRTLRVPENYSTLQAAIDAAPEWAIIRIAPGTFRESLRITKPLTLIGAGREETRIVSADATIPTVNINRTHDVTLKNLAIVGGLYGILVDESQAVTIQDTRVTDADFAGIRLSRASATIVGNEIRNIRGAYGMGIELANTMSRPPSTIRDNLVADNTQEGIVLHMAHGMIERNTVIGNGLRGIAITEMSMATVRANTLMNNADAAIYVVDMSMAEIHGNRVRAVRPGPNGEAHGIRAYYYAEVLLGSNDIEMNPEQAIVAKQGATIERQ